METPLKHMHSIALPLQVFMMLAATYLCLALSVDVIDMREGYMQNAMYN